MNWLLSVRQLFSFDGKHDEEVQYDAEGKSGYQLFYEVDTYGKNKVEPVTRHPNIYRSLMKTKGSINLHIKMYAEDLLSGLMPEDEFNNLCSRIDAPNWFTKAVKNQNFSRTTK